LKATCPKCRHKGLTASFVGVRQSVAIEGVDGDGLLSYGEEKSTGGRLECVRCPACGEVILGGDGKPIRSLAGLAAWIEAGSSRD
jgi:hypothetical protein